MYVTIPTGIDPHAPVISLTSGNCTQAATHIKSGAYLFFEGDRVDWLYQVTSGVLRLTRMLEDGRRQVIAFGYPGDILGFPSDGEYHTDCEALTDACLQPYRRAILECSTENPRIHKALLDAALNEISAMQDHFLMLGRKTAVEKVASFLCVLNDRVGHQMGGHRQMDLSMSRRDIADFLGLTTETVSRTLTQLRKVGIITIDNIHTIVVKNPDALQDLSQGNSRV